MTESSKKPGQQLTRRLSPEEAANVAGIVLDESDVHHFMGLLEKGLVAAAAAADPAVQEDMGLSAEVSVRISRPVREKDGTIGEVVGRDTVTGQLRARKVFKDPANKPQVD